MELKVFSTVFVTVFLAEIADKTQLATMLYASNEQYNRWLVFAGSALALVLASALAVFAGALLSQVASERTMTRIAGAAFVLVGVLTIARS